MLSNSDIGYYLGSRIQNLMSQFNFYVFNFFYKVLASPCHARLVVGTTARSMNKYILTLLLFIFINLMCFIIRHISKDF